MMRANLSRTPAKPQTVQSAIAFVHVKLAMSSAAILLPNRLSTMQVAGVQRLYFLSLIFPETQDALTQDLP